MSRAIPGRLAALESRHQLRALQQAITQSFLEAADEIGLPVCTRMAIRGALESWYTRYPLPPVGWEWNIDQAYAVADAHTLAARRILDAHLPDRPALAAICGGMHARLMAFVRGYADDPA